MRVSLSWLRDYVDAPADPVVLEKALVRVGLEVEEMVVLADNVTGPLVVGRVLSIEELTGFKKPIRHTMVDVGNPEPQSIVSARPTSPKVTWWSSSCRAPFSRATSRSPSVRPMAYVSRNDLLRPRAGAGRRPQRHHGAAGRPRRDAGRRRAAGHRARRHRDRAGHHARPRLLLLGARRGPRTGPRAGVAVHRSGLAGDAVVAQKGGYDVRIEDPKGCDRFTAVAVRRVDPHAATRIGWSPGSPTPASDPSRCSSTSPTT